MLILTPTLALPAQGPWNHSARLERLPNAVFSAVVDPNLDLANKRIKDLQQGELCIGPLCNAACMQAWPLPGAALHALTTCSHPLSSMLISAVRAGCSRRGHIQLTAPRAVHSPTSSTSTDRVLLAPGRQAYSSHMATLKPFISSCGSTGCRPAWRQVAGHTSVQDLPGNAAVRAGQA